MRREIVLLSLAAFASAASMRVADAMLPRIGSEFQVGLSQASAVITVFSVAYGLRQIAFGPLGDRFGKLRVSGLAALCAGIATLACVLAPLRCLQADRGGGSSGTRCASIQRPSRS